MQRYEVKADLKSSAKIFVAAAVAAITTYLSLNFLNTVEWVRLITGGTIFLAVYILTAPTIKAINQSDIKNLRAMFSNLGIISKLINIPLIIAEKVAQIYYPSPE
jgi:hypothetical protein